MTIVSIETRTYNPYVNTAFRHSDEIRIPIQQQDLYTLPCENFLNIEGRLTSNKENADQQSTLGNNCVFMFDEIRYELNGTKIDRNRNVGMTSLVKSYASYSGDFTLYGKFPQPVFNQTVKRLITCDGYFNLRIIGHVVGLLRLQTCSD